MPATTKSLLEVDSDSQRDKNFERRSATMRIVFNSITTLLVAGSAVAAIATAPIAAAGPSAQAAGVSATSTVVTDHLGPAVDRGAPSRRRLGWWRSGGGWASGLGGRGFGGTYVLLGRPVSSAG